MPTVEKVLELSGYRYGEAIGYVNNSPVIVVTDGEKTDIVQIDVGSKTYKVQKTLNNVAVLRGTFLPHKGWHILSGYDPNNNNNAKIIVLDSELNIIKEMTLENEAGTLNTYRNYSFPYSPAVGYDYDTDKILVAGIIYVYVIDVKTWKMQERGIGLMAGGSVVPTPREYIVTSVAGGVAGYNRQTLDRQSYVSDSSYPYGITKLVGKYIIVPHPASVDIWTLAQGYANYVTNVTLDYPMDSGLDYGCVAPVGLSVLHAGVDTVNMRHYLGIIDLIQQKGGTVGKELEGILHYMDIALVPKTGALYCASLPDASKVIVYMFKPDKVYNVTLTAHGRAEAGKEVTLEATVTDINGSPVQGIEVCIYATVGIDEHWSISGDEVTCGKTDNNGKVTATYKIPDRLWKVLFYAVV